VSQTPSPPAGWYPEPSGDAHRERWWDGGSWTTHERLAAAPAFAPPVAPSPASIAMNGDRGAGSPADALPKATWLSRLSASVIDAVLVAVVALTADLVVGDLGADSVGTGPIAYFTLAFLYPPTALALNRGRTWGKQIVGIRVVREDAGELGFGMAFARESLVKGIFTLFTIPFIVDGLFPLWDGRRRALHDIMLGTRVVLDDTPAKRGGSRPGPL
jgi:uncharacterized RDD family membrane protein YckC